MSPHLNQQQASDENIGSLQRTDVTDSLLDDFVIRSLVVRERYFKDTEQWDAWRSTYHSDPKQTWIDIAWISGDIDKFVKESKDMTKRVQSKHFIEPVDVNINGDKALATSYGHITLRFTENDREYDMVSWGWWIHRAVRIDPSSHQWALTTMRFIYDRDSIVPTCPLKEEKVLFVPPAGARPSYKYLEWTLNRRGYTISRTLPGSDDRSSVDETKASENAWLHS